MNGFGSFNLRVNGPTPPNGLGSFMLTISRTNGDPISVSELVGNLPAGVHFIAPAQVSPVLRASTNRARWSCWEPGC